MQNLQSFKHTTKTTSFPSNVQEFINRRPEFKEAVSKAKRYLKSSLNRSYCGGTAIGKNYDTLILDISYQGGEVYIYDNVIKVCGTVVNNSKEFKLALMSKFNIIES